jgi:hypothetical protein
MKITKWEELDGAKSGDYCVKVIQSNGSINVEHKKDKVNSITMYRHFPKELRIEILKAFGFDIEFTEPRKLSSQDYHLVRAFGDGWFCRSNEGYLYFCENKFLKENGYWRTIGGYSIRLSKDALPFITFSDEQPYSTAQLKEMEMMSE